MTRYISDPSQSTSAGWRDRQTNAAARHAAQLAAWDDPEQAEIRRFRSKLMAAHAEADATARARAEYDQPVAPTVKILANGHLHRTRLAVFEAMMQAIGATGTARDALSLESRRKAQALMPNAVLVWPPGHVEDDAAPAADAPRRGRPPKASNSIVVEIED